MNRRGEMGKTAFEALYVLQQPPRRAINNLPQDRRGFAQWVDPAEGMPGPGDDVQRDGGRLAGPRQGVGRGNGDGFVPVTMDHEDRNR